MEFMNGFRNRNKKNNEYYICTVLGKTNFI